jgi:hypothetical protein
MHFNIGNGGSMSYCRKPLLLLILSVCFCLTGPDQDVRAQVPAPDGYYLFGGPAVEQGHAVAVMPDGSGYVIAGDIRENDQDDWDIIVIRLDDSCRQIWQRRIGGPDEDHSWGLTGTRDGGVVISGATSSFGANGNDILIVKLNPDGTEAWRSLLGGPGDQGRGSVLATPENELLVAGWSRSGERGDFHAAKLTSAGEIVWERSYDHWYLEGVNDIARAPDGKFLLYGEGILHSGGEMNGQLVVIDTAGELQQRSCLPQGMYREGYGIAVTADGRCAVTGPARTENGFRAYVTGFDRTGHQIWSGYYPADNWAIGFGICAIRSGGFCQTGWGRTAGRGSDAVLVSIGEDGSQLWIRYLGGAGDENGIRVVEKPTGGFLIVGTTGSFGAGGGEDILIIHTNAEGHPVSPGVR